MSEEEKENNLYKRIQTFGFPLGIIVFSAGVLIALNIINDDAIPDELAGVLGGLYVAVGVGTVFLTIAAISNHKIMLKLIRIEEKLGISNNSKNITNDQDAAHGERKPTEVSNTNNSWLSKFKDEFWITDLQKNPNKNYILMIIGIVAALALVGNLLAASLTVEPIDPDYSKDLETFSLNTEIKNINNEFNGLIRETELLSYTTTITSKSSKPTFLHYTAKVIRAGETKTFDSRTHIPIEPFNSTEITTLLSLPEAGINSVELNFKLNEDRSRQIGGVTSGDGFLGEYRLGFSYRVLTQSEYVTEVERIWVYQLLWITATPFVIMGVKSLKDILKKDKAEES